MSTRKPRKVSLRDIELVRGRLNNLITSYRETHPKPKRKRKVVTTAPVTDEGVQPRQPFYGPVKLPQVVLDQAAAADALHLQAYHTPSAPGGPNLVLVFAGNEATKVISLLKAVGAPNAQP